MSIKIQFTFISMSSCILMSCSSIKPYPVCCFDVYPIPKEDKEQHLNSLVTKLKRIDPDASASGDGQWIFAKTSYWENKHLMKSWPRIACYGTVTSGTEVKRQSDCVKHLTEVIRSQEYNNFDIKNPAELSDQAQGLPNVICRGGDEY